MFTTSDPVCDECDRAVCFGYRGNKELLIQQIAAPVRWQQSVEEMIRQGVDTFVEIGPGRTLSGFLRKINRDVKVYQVSKWEDIEKAGKELC